MVRVQYVVFLLHFCTLLSILQASTYYLVTERPVIKYLNTRYVSFFNVTAFRYSRRNPMYYVNMHITTPISVDNNVTFDIYFYEHLYSQYRLSFLEFHFKWCNLFLNDMFFASGLRKTLPPKCPHPPGTYHLYNLTLNADAIPEYFPFTTGRIVVNASYRGELVASGYADLELKKYKKTKL